MYKIYPTMIITGFLEAGKSCFIQNFLESDEVNRFEHILLLVCEEGEVEYESERFRSEHVKTIYFESLAELEPLRLSELAAQHRANRVIIEYNGMWKLAELVQKLPDCFNLSRVITVVDGESFSLYSANLRSLLLDKLHFSHEVLIDRAGDSFDASALEELAGLSASRGRFFTATENWQLSPIKSSRATLGSIAALSIDNEDFPRVYRDIFTDLDTYDGCRLTLNGRLIKDAYGTPALGRYTMVCCLDDLAFSGFPCEGTGLERLVGQWVTAQGTLSLRYSRSYGQTGPFLTLESVSPASVPQDEILLP